MAPIDVDVVALDAALDKLAVVTRDRASSSSSDSSAG